ncbi:MAG: Bifunctional protein GlmU [Methanomassiliicoccales archaeon PtaU1.Bin124]|nr:MAG: Bifunctional protein GlmU [Methanomassiliicoccales archaeon PtaU1.Bin124]
MKAVILAGGMGTRLRPITYAMPKPLVPLVSKPMVMHIIDSLPNEVDTVVLAVSYMKEKLEEYFSSHDCGRKIVLVNEDQPLGTGGALKNVSSYLDDTFFAFNGDVLCSLDLNDMLKVHRARGGIGSIALWDVEDPTAFGVVGTTGDDRITVFQEKPKREEAASNSINAGVYIFEPEIFSHIGSGVVSLEREVFPKVLEKGLYAQRFSGYWVDCGTRDNYVKAQRILLERGSALVQGCTIDSSVIKGQNRLIGTQLEGCTVGPYVTTFPGCRIMKGAVVSNSMLMDNVVIEEGAVVKDSLIGPGYVVKRGEKVESNILA